MHLAYYIYFYQIVLASIYINSYRVVGGIFKHKFLRAVVPCIDKNVSTTRSRSRDYITNTLGFIAVARFMNLLAVTAKNVFRHQKLVNRSCPLVVLANGLVLAPGHQLLVDV